MNIHKAFQNHFLIAKNIHTRKIKYWIFLISKSFTSVKKIIHGYKTIAIKILMKAWIILKTN